LDKIGEVVMAKKQEEKRCGRKQNSRESRKLEKDE
jgi:hypothetical protein